MFARCASLSSSMGRTLATRKRLGRSSLTGLRSMSVTNISDMEATDKFTEINSKSVLYFTATWCPPCKAIKPVYEELSEQYDGIGFGKIDIDDNQDAAVVYQISSVPTFIFFEGQKPYKQFSGADQNQLESIIKELDQA